MRIRNFIPLTIYVLPSLPLGLGFLFIWQGHALVICGMQAVGSLLLWLVYRAGIHSAQKNFSPRPVIGKIIYLPLWVNFTGYFVVGIPVILVFAANFTVLAWGYTLSLVGFSLAYISGIVYVARSAPHG
jgi:hypothetical protein